MVHRKMENPADDAESNRFTKVELVEPGDSGLIRSSSSVVSSLEVPKPMQGEGGRSV